MGFLRGLLLFLENLTKRKMGRHQGEGAFKQDQQWKGRTRGLRKYPSQLPSKGLQLWASFICNACSFPFPCSLVFCPSWGLNSLFLLGNELSTPLDNCRHPHYIFVFWSPRPSKNSLQRLEFIFSKGNDQLDSPFPTNTIIKHRTIALIFTVFCCRWPCRTSLTHLTGQIVGYTPLPLQKGSRLCLGGQSTPNEGTASVKVLFLLPIYCHQCVLFTQQYFHMAVHATLRACPWILKSSFLRAATSHKTWIGAYIGLITLLLT